jgi:hypothetical protein
MITRPSCLSCLLIVLSSGVSLASHAGGIYKWVDGNGVVHFGEKPPASAQSQTVTVKGTAPSSDAVAAQKRLDDLRAASSKPARKDDGATAAQDEENRKKIARNCEIYRNNLETMKNNPRVKETLPNGEMVFIGDDEKTKRLAETEKLIAKHCKDAGLEQASP